MSFIRSLILTGIILFAAVHFGSNYVVAQGLGNWLGVPVKVGAVRWGLESHRFIAKNVRIQNPAGYSGKDLVRISRIQADYDASELRHGMLKVTRLEAGIDEIRLERKSVSEANILEMNPIRAALHQEIKQAKQKGLPIYFQIEKVKLEMGKVFFQTQLGNDQVTENRPMKSPDTELTVLTTPDRIVVYVALLALQSAGWQSILPTKLEAANQIQTQMNEWVEQLREQALLWQAQVNQIIAEKLGKKS